ncbi:Ger(x)C family spore germination protein [Cytobacillus sp. NJ13]|nr:Ger(x)C family spore germination protein [Cytobacillus sp. NJ13]
MKINNFLWCTFIPLLLAGCIPSTKILEDIQLVQTFGYDYVNDDEFEGTAGSSNIPPGEQSLPVNEVFTATGKTGKRIRQKMQGEAARPIVVGRVGLVIFNQELAEHGIENQIDSLQRNPSIGRKLLLVVSKEKAKDIIDSNYSQSDSVSQYLIDVVEQNLKQTIPEINLHRFLVHYYSKDADPFLPLIEKQGKHLKVSGLGIFKDDKLVDTISFGDAYIFKILYEKFRRGQFEVELSGGEDVSLENLSSKTKISVEKKNGKYKTTFKVKVSGRAMEGVNLDLTDKKTIERIEKAVEKEITERAEKMVKRFQELDADPLRIGEKARQRSDFNRKEWKEQYSQMEIKIEAEVHAVQSGIIE